jgi:pimeloyl-ACP methyl ester carboxylesterase
MSTVRINGFDMYYRERGQGPPLVLAHGLMGSIDMMDALGENRESLSRPFRLINYDARGHGRSGYTPDPAHYSWHALAEDLFALLRHLGIERAHVGGGSMGAGTSLVFALGHPEMVDRLVLIAPPPLGEDMGPVQRMFLAFAAIIEAQGLEKAVEVAMGLPQLQALRESNPQEFEWTRGWLLSQNPRAIVPAIRGLLGGPPLPEERFPEIRARTLVVAHPDDDIHPLASGRQLQESIPDCHLVVAPTMTHYREHPQELADIVEGFLQDSNAPPPPARP